MKLPYEIFVSLRYLKTKKRYGTVSLNTFISIAGVVIGVATSIITLSVMTGFQGYFRDKILSAISHVVVMEYSGTGVKDIKSLEEKIGRVAHVTATTPFIISQAMLTNRDRVQGVVVRGIDPRKEGTVTSLEKNMTAGSLLGLEHAGQDPGHRHRRGPGAQVRDVDRRYAHHGESYRRGDRHGNGAQDEEIRSGGHL